MSALTISSSAGTAGNYVDNVFSAARALVAAIFNVQPAARATTDEKARQVSLMRLYRLASSYDSVMPNMAQELRAIAQRG